jgi:putative phosphoesterase
MRIGIFADAHDHVDNVRHAVNVFNAQRCELVIFAGDFCSPIVVPPLRKLHCRVLAVFGDNDGNQVGIRGGMAIIGEVADVAVGLRTPDGIRIVIAHTPDTLKGLVGEADVVITAHTHRPQLERTQRRLFVNPGETGGWFYRKPTVAVLETAPLDARIIPLPEMPPPPVIESF